MEKMNGSPQSLEEAITNNDLETSMEIANDINNNLSVNLESELKDEEGEKSEDSDGK